MLTPSLGKFSKVKSFAEKETDKREEKDAGMSEWEVSEWEAGVSMGRNQEFIANTHISFTVSASLYHRRDTDAVWLLKHCGSYGAAWEGRVFSFSMNAHV